MMVDSFSEFMTSVEIFNFVGFKNELILMKSNVFLGY